MDAQVLVVGAGPTGLLLAAELRRRGVECMLIDSREEPNQWDRATIIHPRSMELFAAIGIAERFLEAGVKQPGIRLYSGGESVGEMDLSTSGSPFGFNLNMSEEVTEAILTEFLAEQGGEVSRGQRMVELEQREDSVLATIEHDGGSERVEAEWVVGCGGLHSVTRQFSAIEFEGHDIPEPWAVLDVTLEGFSREFDFTHAFLERYPVILSPLPE